MVAGAPAHPVRDHCFAPARPVDAPIAPVEGRYGRLFPQLEPLGGDDEVLLALGAPGGLCDATGRDEPEGAEPAGWPFFGQFLAHDITADRSPIGPQADPEAIANFHAPRINLECVYGAGPVGAPFLYDRDDAAKLLVGDDDVPRNAQGIALLGDPRNDVHRFISQLHVGMLRGHNLLVDRLREDGVDEADCFDSARRALMWHVQWVVVEEFLPGLVGRALVDELLDAGRRCYRPEGSPFIPFEFADAAFRYGHGQIREAYRVNDRADGLAVFPDLVGFGPLPREHVIDWPLLFGATAQRAKRMDRRLAPSLINLPVAITGSVAVEAYHSLAARDLQRGAAIGLPSGEAIARAMGVEPLATAETGLAAQSWRDETPLWLYVQLEADARGDGSRLGPVGGRMVAEVLLGLLDADPESYRANDPSWSPTLPVAGERFSLLDLLTTAAGPAAAR